MSYLHGKFVWFEHLSNDLPKARKFYEALLGWHVENMPMGEQPYPMILNGNEGIGGFRAAPPGAPAGWMSYLSVADVDASYKAALAAGAKGLMAPENVGHVGRGATLADPTGAVLSLWKGAEGDRPDPARAAAGDWLWNELATPDERAALAFYEKVFGFGHDTMPGPHGSYTILKAGDKGRAGIMKAMDPAMPATWMPYVAVGDCDASTAKAQALGAKAVCVPPTDIPQIGRFSVVLDPLGAVFAMMVPAEMT